MTKAEIISQLKSLRDSTEDFAYRNCDTLSKRDVEALDTAIDFLNQTDREASPNYDLVPDCVPVIRCKDCKFSRELRSEDTQGRQFIEDCIWCANWKYAVMPEDYCSNAKRKQN